MTSSPPSPPQFKTTISSDESAARASPFAKTARARSWSSDTRTFSEPNPRASVTARLRSVTRSSSPSPFRTNTLQRESNAPLTSKDGFSVVAPMRMMLPRSTNGRNASCCALLKRWISSTKTIVLRPKARSSSAWCITSLISLMPLVTAENVMNRAFVVRAITFASVVLPTPGGPQKIIEGTTSRSIIPRSIFPSPTRCDWPTTSSSVRGRRRSASGTLSSGSPSVRPEKRLCSTGFTLIKPNPKPWTSDPSQKLREGRLQARGRRTTCASGRPTGRTSSCGASRGAP